MNLKFGIICSQLIDAAERQRAIPISCIGAKTLKTLRNLCSPDRPEVRTFNELVEVLRTFYGKKTTIPGERTKSIRRLQGVDENIDKYCEKLHELALTCDVGAQLEGRLKDQLRAGCKSESVRKRLFENETKTYNECLQIARNLEVIEKEMRKPKESVTTHAVMRGLSRGNFGNRRSISRGSAISTYAPAGPFR